MQVGRLIGRHRELAYHFSIRHCSSERPSSSSAQKMGTAAPVKLAAGGIKGGNSLSVCPFLYVCRVGVARISNLCLRSLAMYVRFALPLCLFASLPRVHMQLKAYHNRTLFPFHRLHLAAHVASPATDRHLSSALSFLFCPCPMKKVLMRALFLFSPHLLVARILSGFSASSGIHWTFWLILKTRTLHFAPHT